MKRADCYEGLACGIITALDHMRRYTPENYPAGRVDINGDDLHLLLNTYETHSPEGALCEVHKAYIDVMYMLEGEEIIYVKPTNVLCAVTKPYDPSIDALLANGKKDHCKGKIKLTKEQRYDFMYGIYSLLQ